jgi:hypothetical protein
MDSDLRTIDQAAPPGRFDRDLGARALDQFFWRWPLFVLPLLLCIAIGVVSARGINPEYRAAATMSASANPLIEETPVRGSTIGSFETPADGTARLINEQLATDAFLDEVATRAGVMGAIEAGLIDRDVVRRQVGAGARGDSVLVVEASWGDPRSSFLLVDATVSAYLDYVVEVVSEDSLDAIALLEDVREAAEVRVVAAEAELEAYLFANPAPLDPDVELPLGQRLAIQRLNDALTSANDSFQDVGGQIDAAELAAQRAQSDAGRQIRVIDEPQLPTEPEPIRMDQLIRVVSFTALGLLVSGAALLLTVSLDGSVRLRSQLGEAVGTSAVAVVPKLKRRERARSTEPAKELV